MLAIGNENTLQDHTSFRSATYIVRPSLTHTKNHPHCKAIPYSKCCVHCEAIPYEKSIMHPAESLSCSKLWQTMTIE